MQTRVSETRTPYQVDCPFCGPVFLTREYYNMQMGCANSKWACGNCGEQAIWNDNNYEDFYDKEAKGAD